MDRGGPSGTAVQLASIVNASGTEMTTVPPLGTGACTVNASRMRFSRLTTGEQDETTPLLIPFTAPPAVVESDVDVVATNSLSWSCVASNPNSTRNEYRASDGGLSGTLTVRLTVAYPSTNGIDWKRTT